jgi:hypothetical protein
MIGQRRKNAGDQQYKLPEALAWFHLLAPPGSGLV